MSRDYDYSEDMFADTRMSFGEHLEELRMHMWRAIKGFLVALFFSFFIGKPVLQVIAAPVEEQLEAFYDARVERIAKEISEHPGEYETDQPKEVNLDVDVRSLQKTLGLQSVYEKLKLKPEAGSGSQWVQIKARINPHSWTMALHKAMRQVGRRPGLTTLSIQEAFMAYFKVCIYCGDRAWQSVDFLAVVAVCRRRSLSA
ncbi:MAG: hypothetical protein KatS3mg105_2345 [Gemmatales bacterium]|nr:MAG: hypothetical protein KatS3mg105_2345 [Gemmatales bacterium]